MKKDIKILEFVKPFRLIIRLDEESNYKNIMKNNMQEVWSSVSLQQNYP